MTAPFTGDMKSILDATKSTLLSYRGVPDGAFLKNVTTFKLGILSPMTVFPAISILPDYDQIVRWYTGRKALMQRGFTLGVYVKGMKSQECEEQANLLAEQIADLLMKAKQLKNKGSGFAQGFDLKLENLNLNTMSDIPIASATLNFSVLGEMQFPRSADESKSPLFNKTIDDLNKAILKQLTYKAKADLEGLASIVHGSIDDSIVFNFPSILMKELDEAIDNRVYAGANKKVPSYIFNVCVKRVPDERLVYKLMQLTDGLRNVLIESDRWGGLAVTSNVGRIEYLSENLKGSPIYVAQIPYTVETLRKTTFIGE